MEWSILYTVLRVVVVVVMVVVVAVVVVASDGNGVDDGVAVLLVGCLLT